MMDHLSFDQLCDLEDGALDPRDSAAARAHLASCAACATARAELTTLRIRTAALPREIAPPDDLWTDIRGRLKPRQFRDVGIVRGWTPRHLAAAAGIIAVASSALTAVVLRGRGTEVRSPAVEVSASPQASTAPDARAPALPARLALAENRYASSVVALQHILDERSDSLAPSTIAIVERSLRVADSAIAEARLALAHDPANAALGALFASNYERKIDLLRRATELAPRT